MSDNPGYTADFIKSDTDRAVFTVREAKKGVLFFGRVHATRNA